MIHNHFLIALRNMRRNGFFSFINISGLAVGLAACWLIGLFVFHEKNFDSFLPHADRICAVAFDLKMGDQEGLTTNTPPPVGPRLAADFPEIEMTARTFHLGSVVVRRDGSDHTPLIFNEEAAMAVDTAFLELFGFPMTAGDASMVLDKPGSLVLTEKMAEKYFGDTPAIGQSLLVNDRLFTVTGIVKNLSSTSTVQFDFLLPMTDFNVVERFSWSWIWLQVDTWVRLRQAPNAESLASLEAKFPAMVRAYAPAAYARIGQNFEEQLKRGDRLDIKLIPLKNLHLDSGNLISRLTTLGDGRQVRIFGIVGGLILLLACVNFMNLSTARSMKRAREVSVRKALGSQRGALAAQFLTEALLFSLVSMLLAGVLASAALPFFNQLTGLNLCFSDLYSLQTIGFVAVLPLLTGLFGGLYPAFYLSTFKAAEIFKTAPTSAKGGHAGVRSGLVVLQFSVSIALMLISFVVYRQLEFAQKQSPGLQRENVLVLPNVRHLTEPAAREAFRQQLLQMPEAVSATHSTYLPSLGSFGDFYEPEQGDQSHPVVQNLPVSSFLTDADFVPTLGIEILAGRNFLPNSTIDSTSVILNEAAVKAIGWENPIGKWMRYPGNENQRFQVVGVMRDFHIASVKMTIEPTAIFHESSKTYRTWGAYMAVRLQPGTEKSAIEKTSALWKSAVPGAPFEYDFLDASFARLYRSEAKTSSVLGVFTGLALFIGCLGLFALAAFMAEQRTKEIGIRKILGASVAGITGLLAKDFLKLVLVAILIASPVAWWAMNKWLQDFVYRIDIQWWMFVAAGLAAIAIAFLTVGFQSIKAALANPVKSLRNE
ncbi:MAG: ABC transporter permease [Saprospiraceae bacterium]|nr:ABC transporter permease [Saprospiraceae bacterium]